MLGCVLVVVALAPAQPPKKAPTPAQVALAELRLDVAADKVPELPKAYAADDVTLDDVRKAPAKYPLRAAVLQAADALHAARRLVPETRITEQATGQPGKKRVRELQEPVARVILQLEEAIEALAAADRKAEASKRWQAHADFALAEMHRLVASTHEYNLALGRVRTETLPALDKSAGQSGWRLRPVPKVQSKPARDAAAEARKRFVAVTQKYPATPWARLADALADADLGLDWEAFSPVRD